MIAQPNRHVTDTVIHGDCIDVMRQMSAASVDLILTDPPYITRYRSRDGQTVRNDDNDRWLSLPSPKRAASSSRVGSASHSMD